MKRQERGDHIMSNFLRDVKNHEMTVLKDDGVYRHLQFRNPKDSACFFNIVTYPHHLTYSGDMGCYSFTRLEDMFNFFRTDGDELSINIGYWAEKLESVDTHSPCAKEWDADLHKEWIKDTFEEWKYEMGEEDDCSNISFNKIWKAVEEDLMHPEHEYDAYARLDGFQFDNDELFDEETPCPFDGNSIDDYHAYQTPYRLFWCMFALNWAIKQYDNYKKEEAHV